MKTKYYAFLDVVLDVFYSIILYNAFVSFPGFKLESLLMVFAVFVMINYWWTARSFGSLPKYYLTDFYFVTLVMFIFSQWPAYFTNPSGFFVVLVIFLVVDAIYSLVAIFAHKEKEDEKLLWYYFIFELFLAAIYGAGYYLVGILSLGPILIYLFVPYLMFYLASFKYGALTAKFSDTGNQPY